MCAKDWDRELCVGGAYDHAKATRTILGAIGKEYCSSYKSRGKVLTLVKVANIL